MTKSIIDAEQVAKRIQKNGKVRSWLLFAFILSLLAFYTTRDLFLGVGSVLILVLMASVNTGIKLDKIALLLYYHKEMD